MALQVESLKREFSFKKGKETVRLPDPNPAFTNEEVGKYYASKYPELTTSTLEGPVITGETAAYEFKTTVGTKG